MSGGAHTRVAWLAAPAAPMFAVVKSALAADPVPPNLGASPVSFLGLIQVVLALTLVLGVIALFAWLLRRFAPGQGSAGGLLKVIGGVMVGPKERVVVIEVGDTWLLLGVAASGVNLVHSMPKPATSGAASVDAPSTHTPRVFARLLNQALGSRTPEA